MTTRSIDEVVAFLNRTLVGARFQIEAVEPRIKEYSICGEVLCRDNKWRKAAKFVLIEGENEWEVAWSSQFGDVLESLIRRFAQDLNPQSTKGIEHANQPAL